MKKMKKFFALLIAVVMVLSMSTMAFADDGDLTVDDSISVTDLTEGDEVSYYQVIEWVSGSGWALTEDFASLGDDVLAAILEGTLTQDMADDIAELAADATATGTGTADSDGTWSVDDPDPGLYMVLITAVESGVVYNPAFVAADYDGDNTTNTISIEATYSDTSVAKKTTITVVKTEEDSDSETAAAIDSYVGQEVTFNIDTTIPVFLSSYTNPTFVITDSVTEGIELNTDSIEITLGENTYTAEDYPDGVDGIYTLAATTSGFTVTFDSDYLAANTSAVSVSIEYTGTVTNAAEFNVNQDENTVTVTYSNGPDGDLAALKDETNTYVFSIGATLLGSESTKTSEIVKVGVDDEGNYVVEEVEVSSGSSVGALPGATFGLYTDEACTTLYKNDLYEEGATFTTGDDGVITFNGLAAGTYYLKEISAPDGYIADTTVHTIVISAEYEDVTVTETDETTGIEVTYTTSVLSSYTISYDGSEITYEITNDGPTSESTVIDYESFEVNNTEGVELPSTGGIGTTIFYVIGAILVIGAGVVLVTRRRMNVQ